MRELTDFDEMYQELIIDHYKNPRNKSKLTKFTDEVLSHNPFCGDEIEPVSYTHLTLPTILLV